MSNDFFYSTIESINKNLKIRGGKSNFTLLTWYISYFKKLGDDITKENPSLSLKDVKLEIKKKVIETITKYTIVRLSSSHVELITFMYYFSLKKFSENDEILAKFLKNVKRNNYNEISNFYISNYIKLDEILRGDLGVNSSYDFFNKSNKQELQGVFKEMFSPYSEECLKFFKMPKGKADELLKELFKKMRNLNTNLLMAYYIANMLIVANFLEETNQMERYVSFNNSNNQKFFMYGLSLKLGDEIEELREVKNLINQVKKENGEFNYQGIDMMDFISYIDSIKKNPLPNEMTFRDGFRIGYLKSMSIEEILVLNCFWQNKFSKEIKNLFEAFVMIESLELWDEIISGRLNYKNISEFVSDEEYLLVKKKTEFLLKYSKKKHFECPEVMNSFLNYSYTSSYAKQEYKDSEKYKKYFLSLKNNSLKEEIDQYMPVYRAIEASYYSKNLSIYSFLLIASSSKKIKNYGLVIKDFNDFLSSNICVVVIDCPRIIAPLKIHVERNKLKEFLIKVKGNTSFPIYKGFEDFSINGEFYSSNILMPMSKSYSDTLKEEARAASEKTHLGRLSKHLAMLANGGRVPSHFKSVKNSGQKVFIREYIDIYSTVIFTDEKKSFYKITDFEV